MVGAGLVAALVVAVLGGLIGQSRGGSLSDGLWTLAPMWFGVFLSGLMLNIVPARAAGMWAGPVLFGTMVRAGVVLGLGYGLFLGVSPEKNVYFLTLVSSLIAVLTVDVLTTVRMIQQHTPGGNAQGVVEGS